MLPDWSGNLRNLYWFLRYRRAFDTASRRKYYRRIEAEKKRLIDSGVDPEAVRLCCRYLSNLKNSNAERRFYAYCSQLKLPF